MKKMLLSLFIVTMAIGCQPDDIVEKPTTTKTTPFPFPQPAHMPKAIMPADNPLTKEGVKLGRHLFYDLRLSGDNTMSCGTCHLQENNFSDIRRFSIGIDGLEGDKNSMVIVNMAWQDFFFWDGRKNTLEAQALEPVINPIEMHATWPDVITKIAVDPAYQKMFEDAFGKNSITKENAAKGMAQFMRTMVSANSKYDKMRRGEAQFNNLELLGREIFNNERGDCFHCHAEPVFGAYGLDQFMNNGLDSVLTANSGREGVTNDSLDRAKFKAPSLRNVEYSFPYMHDGRFVTLNQVIEHYNKGGHVTYTIDPNMKKAGIGHNWSQQEKDALIAFLKTLTDTNFLTDTTFTNPW